MTTKILRNRFYNFILPLIFFEWWYVLLALIFVIIIETYVVKLFTKEKFKQLVIILFKANLITTFLGYLLQGIVRLIIGVIIYLTTDKDFKSYPIILGLFGNVGMSRKYSSKFEIAAVSEIITSMIICFVLSVIIERKIIMTALSVTINDRSITKSILVANIVSYLILSLWVFYNFYRAFH